MSIKSLKATHELSWLVDYVIAAHKIGGRPYFYVDRDK